jgi:hypothetical protein
MQRTTVRTLRSQDVRLSNRSLGAVPPFVMDKGDMRLLDLSRNKLTILPNLLVWRSEVLCTPARPVEMQGAQAFKEEPFLEKNENEMYEKIIDDLYEKLYMILKQIK